MIDNINHLLGGMFGKVKTQPQKYEKILNDNYTKFKYDPCAYTDQTSINVFCPNTYTTSEPYEVKYEIHANKNNDKSETIFFNLSKKYEKKYLCINNIKSLFKFAGLMNRINNIIFDIYVADLNSTTNVIIIEDLNSDLAQLRIVDMSNKYIIFRNCIISTLKINRKNLDFDRRIVCKNSHI